ncbi:MAG: V-type ATP synthase subunit I [Synergistaceae bacterium]|nr:V-type ATP synthase subunit I [Synergistaceae bacterium]
MKKARMAAHRSVADEILGKLQKLGCCQMISDVGEKAGESDTAALQARARHIDEILAETRFVMRFIEPYVTEKESGLAKAFGDIPSLSVSELSELASEEEFTEASKEVRILEKRLSEARSGLSRISGLTASLAPLAGLPYSLDFFTKGTESVQGSIFQIPSSAFDGLVSSMESSLGGDAEIFPIPEKGKDSGKIVAVIYARASAEKFQSVIADFQVSRFDVPANMAGLPSDELKRLEAEYAGLKSEEAATLSEISGTANSVYKLCEYSSDYWGLQRDKTEALIKGEQTEQIIVASFWIPSSKITQFEKTLAPYGELTDIAISDPDEGDCPPTLLRNKKFAVPVEPLIDMYGAPAYGGFDPTAVVAPFFYAFFGICFGDAGYGLLIASLLIALMMKKKVTGTLRNFIMILIIGNVCAIVFGALTFSWFGDSITAFPFLGFLKPLGKLQILDPMGDPMTMLGVSLVFGFVQIIFGLLIAFRENLRKGDKIAAYADQGGWIIFLCGLVLAGLASSGMAPLPTKACAITAAVGALILVATQGRSKESVFGKVFSGVLSLYNVTSYLGDLLSYSRLLALGLGSAAVGMVINMLANLVAPSLHGFGMVFGILIFAIGHVFSMAVNLLGAFVHPLRLQYVEFFGKFYEASGEEFSPLEISTQYVNIQDEK